MTHPRHSILQLDRDVKLSCNRIVITFISHDISKNANEK